MVILGFNYLFITLSWTHFDFPDWKKRLSLTGKKESSLGREFLILEEL